MTANSPQARVVVQYDDPRGGTWRGPIEPLADAERRLARERARVHGRAWLERLAVAIAFAVLALSGPGLAAPLPVPKAGQCPAGYPESGGHCAPSAGQRCRAIPKEPGRQCPAGFSQSGNYCLEMRCGRD